MAEITLSLSINELCQLESIEREIIINIVEYGIAEPVAGQGSNDWVFDTSSVHWIKKAARLQRDLEIDWVAVALVIDLMQQKETLQQENLRYRHQLKRFIEK
ncbi:chaperone modulatory protein CbpM [Dasania sp. GY-MA-18]|uniref:Chaperone modulatory protein CbpM n=1 Tax=Dasania phycosphaerae TaxID=2950436 RepID=A0A9J6RH99_9GAMM|nr:MULTISPECIES: chaperone modulator CbpM [Dasania]MCR8921277.1 chaperone modulatory protein CbpM [Dasania sp. GY-MA-18]MCZ0863705.1 chaperone modulatory protein CbpM [Dasania phycosphaerae]MCZ0867433.1 chaperone modulatory protein CbpM [Dasania phycosphaerae]